MTPNDPILEAFVQATAAESSDKIRNPHENSPGFAFFDKTSLRQWKPVAEDVLRAMLTDETPERQWDDAP